MAEYGLLPIIIPFIIGTVIASIIARKKGGDFAKKLLGIWCILVVAYYIVYKIGIQLDEEYAVLRVEGGMPEVSIWTELPIQMCDISLLLLPIEALSKKKVGFLRFFTIFFGIPAAVLAIVVPFPGFTGYSLLIPRVFGYYFTHISIIFSGISLLTFNIYRPTLKNFRWATLMLAVAYWANFLINVILRLVGLSVKSNYFFSYEPLGLVPLEFFYNIIPVPGLYLAVPVFLFIAAIYCLVCYFSIRHSRLVKDNTDV